MAQGDREDILQRYIRRVMALQHERRDALALSDLRAIALDLGMSEEDMIAADRGAQASLERGQRHLRYGRWDDAIAELNDATALNPVAVEPLHSLATAYKERWQRTGNIADSVEAARLARQTLAMSPDHDPSYLLLNELDRKGGIPSPRASSKKAAATTFIVFVPLLIVIFVVIAIVIGVWPSRHPLSPPPPAPVVIVPPSPLPSSPLAGRPIPVTWEAEKDPDVGVEISEISSTVRDGNRVLELAVRNTGKRAISFLELEITDASAGEDGDEQSTHEVVSDDDAPLAPGETRVRTLEYEVDEAPKGYSVVVTDVE